MIEIRRATIGDLKSLVQFRTALFKEMRLLEGETKIDSFQEACEQYFRQYLPDNKFIAWIAEKNDEIVAASGLVFLQKPPFPENPSGKEAYIMNMFTLPTWRNKGIASELLKRIFDYIQEEGISLISLHTTEIGRGVYEKFGFSLSGTEMKLTKN
jgi:GNAT superfamily N-acetyltransferase